MADDTKTLEERLSSLEERLLEGKLKHPSLEAVDLCHRVSKDVALKKKELMAFKMTPESTALAKGIRALAKEHGLHVSFGINTIGSDGKIADCCCCCNCCSCY